MTTCGTVTTTKYCSLPKPTKRKWKKRVVCACSVCGVTYHVKEEVYYSMDGGWIKYEWNKTN